MADEIPASAAEIAKYADEVIEKGQLTPRTKKNAQELHTRAVKAMEENEPDIGTLDFAMRLVKRSIKEKRDREFAFDLGDWCGDIKCALSGAERESLCKEHKQAQEEWVAAGRTKDEVTHLTRTLREWLVVCGFTTEDYTPAMEAEITAVEQFSSAGEHEERAPQTPVLTRLETIASFLSIDVAGVIQILRHYAKTNELAHSRPPRAELHVDADKETVDWATIVNKCMDKKHSISLARQRGLLSQDQAELAKLVVEIWLRVHVKGIDADGNPITTDNAEKGCKKAVREAKKRAAITALDVPQRPFKKTRWDKSVPKTQP